jgi:hypothetical protein
MADINEPKRKSGFAIIATAVIWAGVAVFGFYSATHMVAAGDTWVALACGRYYAAHEVSTAEPFSFNSHKPGPTAEQLEAWPQWTHGIIRTIHPTGWVNQNWLTHLTFYELVHLFGSKDNPNYNMLVVWKFTLFLATAFVVYAFGRVMGVCPLLAAIASCLAMVVGRTFFDIRPACWSNFFVPLFLLILALAVYRNIRWIWLLVPTVALWANFHGGYIYVYMMIVPFVGLHLISMISRNRLVKIPFRHLLTICYAAIASFIAMILFNPYHLTNLTHTFEISISKHAESWRSVNEWRPAFDFLDKTRTMPNPVGEQEAFGVMCILLCGVLVVWMIAQGLRPRMEFNKKARPDDIEKAYQGWPKIDFPMLAVALFTTYMAVQSRRFIAVAGPAACPVIFLLIQQAWQAVTAQSQYRRNKILEGIVPGVRFQHTSLAVYAVIVLGCGLFWGWEFKKVYMDPWPEDSQYHSVFMRMTASNVKPIDVCKFINDNNMAGRMFNYWTEGGAIAFGQKPDPQTGQIPLKLFMDGRAQAAYNHDTFQLWQYIYYGGPIAQRYRQSGKKMTAPNYREIAEWIDLQLSKYEVWVVLLPASESRKEFCRTLLYSENWKIAYNDPYQMMLVNNKNPQGKQLIDNILADKAKFPNTVSRNLTLCKLIPQQYSSSLAGMLEQAAVAAFAERPCSATMVELFNAGSVLNKSSLIVEQIRRYLADFEVNQETYRRQNGYAERLRCAIMAADFIGRNFPNQNEEMTQKTKRFEAEENRLSGNALW